MNAATKSTTAVDHSASNKKDSKVATNQAQELDISKLSFSQLNKFVMEASALLQSKRDSEIKSLADNYWVKLQASGFSYEDGVKAFAFYGPAVEDAPAKKRAAKGSVVKPQKAYVEGAHYANPADKAQVYPKQNTGKPWKWAKRPEWLTTLVPDTLTHEEAVAKYAELAVK